METLEKIIVILLLIVETYILTTLQNALFNSELQFIASNGIWGIGIALLLAVGVFRQWKRNKKQD